jgi:hypothetical protein
MSLEKTYPKDLEEELGQAWVFKIYIYGGRILGVGKNPFR